MQARLNARRCCARRAPLWPISLQLLYSVPHLMMPAFTDVPSEPCRAQAELLRLLNVYQAEINRLCHRMRLVGGIQLANTVSHMRLNGFL